MTQAVPTTPCRSSASTSRAMKLMTVNYFECGCSCHRNESTFVCFFDGSTEPAVGWFLDGYSCPLNLGVPIGRVSLTNSCGVVNSASLLLAQLTNRSGLGQCQREVNSTNRETSVLLGKNTRSAARGSILTRVISE